MIPRTVPRGTQTPRVPRLIPMADPQQVAPTLELISPVLPGRLFELNKDLVRIGRDPGSDISLNRKDVSWLHAWIFRRPEGFYVEDRESRNRTFLDGVKL